MRKSLRRYLPKRKTIQYGFEIFGWIVFYFVYLLIGGVCMVYIEKDYDSKQKIERYNKLREVLGKYNLSINSTATKEILTAVIDVSDAGAIGMNGLDETVESSWNLGVAVFFCSTVVTTIGYGNLVPLTKNGKLFTILYAIVGIPITGFVLAKIGGGLLKLIEKCDEFFASYIRAIVGRLVEEHKVKIYVRTSQLGIVVLLFIAFFWIIPAAIMTKTEDWDFMTAVYFCFISISTIGLGDVVPGSSTKDSPVYDSAKSSGIRKMKSMSLQLAVLLYLLMGLAALSIILNLVSSILKSIADSTINTAGNLVSNNRKKIVSLVSWKTYRSNKVNPHAKTGSIEADQGNDVDVPTAHVSVTDVDEKSRDKSFMDRLMETDLLEGNTHCSINLVADKDTNIEDEVNQITVKNFGNDVTKHDDTMAAKQSQ